MGYKQRLRKIKQAVFNKPYAFYFIIIFLGVVGGLVGGACPGCIAGFLPAMLGLFGVVGFSLYNLPFRGLEIQVLSIVLLIIGSLLLSRDLTCKIPKKSKNN